jgi:hypothetical protein
MPNQTTNFDLATSAFRHKTITMVNLIKLEEHIATRSYIEGYVAALFCSTTFFLSVFGIDRASMGGVSHAMT